jgi:probable rRNA maturation factor
VTVTDGRGRRIADGGLARWLAGMAPVRLHGEAAIAVVTDAHIRKLNRTFRGKDYVTDVLSFPALRLGSASLRASGPAWPERAQEQRESNGRFFGDIVIATGVAKRQAREAGHSYQTELRVLALHGFLHLLGYDHDHPNDHGRMARAEARLRRRGGLPTGLIARVGARQRREAAPVRASASGWGPARNKR